MTSSPLVIFTMYVYLRDILPSVSNTIRSIGCHVSLANGYSSTYKLKELVGEFVNPFKYRTMVQVCSFVSRSRFSDTHVHQKKGQRILSKPSKSCISSSPTLKKQPIRRRIVSTKSPSHWVERRRSVSIATLTHVSLKFTSVRYDHTS